MCRSGDDDGLFTSFILGNLFILLAIIWNTAFITMATFSGFILIESTDILNTCVPTVWYCIMMLSVLHFIIFWDSMANTFYPIDHTGNNIRLNRIILITAGVSIWATVLYYNMSDVREEFLVNNYKALYNLLHAETWFFFFATGPLIVVNWTNYTLDVRRENKRRADEAQAQMNRAAEIRFARARREGNYQADPILEEGFN